MFSRLIKDCGFNILALIFFGVLLYLLLWVNAVGSATVAVFAAVFCALMGNPDRFQIIKFSLTGVEARAREAIQQAEVSQQQFRKLAAMTGQLIVELNASMGRWDRASPADRDARKAELLSTLHSIGLSNNEIDQVSAADKQWVIFDYVRAITAAGFRRLNEIKTPSEVVSAQMEWSTAVAALTGNNNVQTIRTITPHQLRDLLNRFGVLGGEETAFIEDLDYYLRTGKQKRPDVWARRGIDF